ncbi:MAG: hypothetical protein JOZ16_04545 [Methylobacteriaceae bacterium]|nr:hypothetical protein [Methylobacteriaceae bacterium]
MSEVIFGAAIPIAEFGLDAIAGVVARGHGVASGTARDRRFPNGTIRLQLPFFEGAIANFQAYLGGSPFAGTINIAVDTEAVVIMRPEFRLPEVRWTDVFGPETFYLSAAQLVHGDGRYPVFLYMPDPASKPDHHQPRQVVELLARRLPEVSYGNRVTLLFRPDAIAFTP